MQGRDRPEYRIRIERQPVAGNLQFVRQHVQQDFGVRIGVDVAPIAPEHLLLQGLRVGQVAVVRQRDSERRIHVEGLSFLRVAGRALGRISHLGDTGPARQGAHVACPEDVAHLARALEHVEAVAMHGGDPRGVLAAMLQQQQGVVQQLIDRTGRNDTDNSAHRSNSRGQRPVCRRCKFGRYQS